MRTMQRIVCLLLVLIMAGTLFGCAQELATLEESYPPLADSPEEGGDEAEEAAPAPEKAPEAPKEEKKADPPAEKKAEEPKQEIQAEPIAMTGPQDTAEDVPAPAEEPAEGQDEPAADSGISTISEPGQPVDMPEPNKASAEKEPVYVTMHCTRGTVDGVDSFIVTLADGKLSTGHEPKCDGYVFAGWYKEKDESGEYTNIEGKTKIEKDASVPEGVKDLYAYWTVKPVVTPEPVEVTPDPDKMLETDSTQNNYALGVWLHAFNSSFTEEGKKNQASVWVKFEDGTRNLPKDLPQVASANGTFAGWYTAAPTVEEIKGEGYSYRKTTAKNGQQVDTGDRTVPEGVQVLYPAFDYSVPDTEKADGKFISFKLNWNGMYGMVSALTCTRGYGQDNQTPKFTAGDALVSGLNWNTADEVDATWAGLQEYWKGKDFNGYEFLGWSADPHGSNNLIGNDYDVEDGQTLYAQWEKIDGSAASDSFEAPDDPAAGTLEFLQLLGDLDTNKSGSIHAAVDAVFSLRLHRSPVRAQVNTITWNISVRETGQAKAEDMLKAKAQTNTLTVKPGGTDSADFFDGGITVTARGYDLSIQGKDGKTYTVTVSADATSPAEDGGIVTIHTNADATVNFTHQWNAGVVTVAQATCEKGTETQYECTVPGCDAEMVKYGYPLGHIYDTRSAKGVRITKEPTCTEEGTKVRICLRCQKEEDVEYPVPALGHDWQMKQVTPTDCQHSEYTYECSTCHEEKTETKTVNNPGEGFHKYTETVTPVNCSRSTQVKVCSVCGRRVENTISASNPDMPHVWGGWVVEKEATGLEQGVQTHKCSLCGKQETAYIAKLTPGWHSNSAGGKTYVLNSGAYAIGLTDVGGKPYLFSDSGEVMGSGWQTAGGKKYYLNADGTAKTGWQTISKKKYYFDPATGEMMTGSVMISGKLYLLGADGVQVTGTGWKTVNGKKYYISKNICKTGWQKISKKYYYLGTDGVMRTGWQDVSGKRYYLDSKGVRKTGWQTIDSKKYYFNSSGVMLTGKQKISKKYYYLGADGAALTGWQTIDGKKVYLNASGQILTGWQTIGGKKYYLNSDGTYKTGVQKISKKYYYFDGSGVMQTGWQTISGKKCWFDSKGVRKTGWVTISGKKYYFNSSGEMLTGLQKISKKYYYLGTDGVMRTGWQDINGSRYYFKSNGQAATGKYKISGKTYKFSSSGVLQS